MNEAFHKLYDECRESLEAIPPNPDAVLADCWEKCLQAISRISTTNQGERIDLCYVAHCFLYLRRTADLAKQALRDANRASS